ncbi:MAG: TonB-dependent receptor [Cyclobacteriaceae bacterium]
MLRGALLLLLLFFFSTAFSQNIVILNERTGKPIADVFIYAMDETSQTVSNSEGIASLQKFSRNDIILLTHPSFVTKSLAIKSIDYNNSTVLLSEKIIQIEEVVVSANKWEQDINDVPNQIVSIGAKSISFNNPSTSADLLEQSGQIYVQKSQLGGGSPMLRGFAANSVLLVVDGIRMNNAIYRSGNLQNAINIDPNAISTIEVVFGPGSVIYGSDALGGVMNFKTASPEINNTKGDMIVNAFTRYSTASKEKTAHFDINLSGSKVGFYSSLSYSIFEDLRAGKNRSDSYKGFFKRNFYAGRVNDEDVLIQIQNPELQKFSGYSSLHSSNKLMIKPGKKSTLTYGFQSSTTSDIPRYDALTETLSNADSLKVAEWYYGPQKWLMHSLDYTSTRRTALFTRSNVIVAFQKYKESRNDRNFGASNLRNQQEKVNMLTLNASLEKQFQNSTLFYGFDFAHNYVASTAKRTNIITSEISETSSRYPDAGSRYNSIASYANWVVKLNEKWTLNTGGRLNHVKLSAKTENNLANDLLLGNITQTNQALNGSAGLIFKPSNSIKWNLTLSTGFRAPNVDDVGKVFEIGELISVPNPDLKPEYSYSQELGFSKTNKTFHLNATVFHSLLTNAIVTGSFLIDGQSTYELNGETLNVESQVNAGQARIFGSSIGLKSILNSQMTITSSLTYTEGYEIQPKEPLRHIPPIFGRVGFVYQKEKLDLEVYSVFNFDKKKSDIPSIEFDNKPHLYTDTGSPGWATANVKIAYNLIPEVKLQVGLENILDSHYRAYSSGISAPGRNLLVTLRGSF